MILFLLDELIKIMKGKRVVRLWAKKLNKFLTVLVK